MISRKDRIQAFVQLGEYLSDPDYRTAVEEAAQGAYRKNNWFTIPNVLKSLSAIGQAFLDGQRLATWMDAYPQPSESKKIGVVMAGNIPAVGFHDALAVLASGHTLMAKLSSEDAILLPFLLGQLCQIQPAFREHVRFVERLNDADAFIATGSDNTARYFHYYFSKKPNIIRKNRTSVAILTGNESETELRALGDDMLQYFGLGCRNVSHIFVPEGYDFTKFYEANQELDETYLHHHKYFNNYEYNKSVVLINRKHHYDNGFLMLSENQALVSPISMVYYQSYTNQDDVLQALETHKEKIQCVVSNDQAYPGALPFGKTQEPGLTDYADAVDTMAFLATLS